MDELTAWIGTALRECIDDGRPLPFTLTAVGVNGSLIVARYRAADQDALDCSLIAEHIEKDGFALPINITICDSAGGAEHLVINADKSIQHLH